MNETKITQAVSAAYQTLGVAAQAAGDDVGANAFTAVAGVIDMEMIPTESLFDLLAQSTNVAAVCRECADDLDDHAQDCQGDDAETAASFREQAGDLRRAAAYFEVKQGRKIGSTGLA